MNEYLHQSFMQHALELAKLGRHTVSPNPMVGCVIVRDNTIVGTGYHERAGCAHAEVTAIHEAGENAKNATAYVTLEPCCHYGKTPPCTEALIQAGIKKVYVACKDPNPLVSGKGLIRLKQAGIETHVGLLSDQAIQLNEIFFHFISTRTPFVFSKWAMSLDGKTITHDNDNRIISNTTSHKHAHELRRQVDAIIVGSNTLRNDNPLLTARNTDQTTHSDKQPLRIVLTSSGNITLNLKIFDKTLPGETLIVATHSVCKKWLADLKHNKISYWLAPCKADGRVDLQALIIELGKRGITSVLIEGGMQLHYQFFAENLINRINVYIAPSIIADMEIKQPIHNVACYTLDGDYLISGYFKGNSNV